MKQRGRERQIENTDRLALLLLLLLAISAPFTTAMNTKDCEYKNNENNSGKTSEAFSEVKLFV